jgi:hypothetical protein
MGCCGQKRAWFRIASRVTAPATAISHPAPSATQSVISDSPSVRLRYVGPTPVAVRGPTTGRAYQFTPGRPDQLVDSRDAMPLLQTRYFLRD